GAAERPPSRVVPNEGDRPSSGSVLNEQTGQHQNRSPYNDKDRPPSRSTTMGAQQDDSATVYTNVAETTLNRSMKTASRCSLGSTNMLDDYPIYNPIEDFKFDSGQGYFPIDSSKMNIGIVGRSFSGKSALINALRGLSFTDQYAAGRYPCEKMEPFTFIEEELRETVLWEIPYPRLFSNVSDIYDRSMGFDRFYE
ncbi:unnamed protein product, partial [Anisakis simplex]|uniref:IRG-type G domain-containing protein n=1 Tax=Anisakis simplex TaxID=6269 RepID=A0A0M3K006_ANISI